MKLTFKGNIGADAVLRKTSDGTSVCDFWVAENILKRDKTKETQWHKVTIWRGYADTMAQWLKKGRRIEVSADYAKPNFYIQKETQKVIPFFDVRASELELLDAPEAPRGDVPPEVAAAAEIPAANVDDDELPFD